MRQLRVLITAGPTYEYIDPVRIITNPSSGKMGIAIAKVASRLGAKVTLIYGPGSEMLPANIKVIRVKTTAQMRKAVINELKKRYYHLVFATAACADFTPIKPYSRKISSVGQRLTISLKPTPKIINEIKKVSPKTFLVAFKAEYRIKKNELITKTFDRLQSSQADFVVVNDVSKPNIGFQTDMNEVYLINSNRRIIHLAKNKKSVIAKKIINIVLSKINNKIKRISLGGY